MAKLGLIRDLALAEGLWAGISPKILARCRARAGRFNASRNHALLDIANLDRLAGHPVVGGSWEGFVIETLLSVLPDRTQPLFYHTAVRAEIVLLLERPDGTLWAIEVKRGLAAKPKRGFSIACEDLSPSRAFIVYSGEARYPVAAGIEALGVREMAGLLARSSPQALDKVSPSPP